VAKFEARAATPDIVYSCGGSMSPSDEELVRKARGGDRPAFEELVRRTSRLVFARLYLETGDVHKSEDLLQDTLLAAYRALHQLEDPAGFRAWLLAIAQNMVVDTARREARKKRTAPEPNDNPLLRMRKSEPPPEEHAEREEMRQQVLAVLRSLPEEYRLPLTLRYIGGADYETIGIQLGLTNGSLRGLLHRGLKMLRAKMPAEFGEEKN
jgi:RNA polymerase sigma-70 factor (ECF subfamily)